MQKHFLKIILFSFILLSGFTSYSYGQLTISDLSNTIVELRLSPSHVEVGDSIHSVGYVNLINKNGFLVKPHEDVTVMLSSGNPSIATVPNSITINADENFATFDIITQINVDKDKSIIGQGTVIINANNPSSTSFIYTAAS